MKEININDLIKGQIYHITLNKDKGRVGIFKFDSIKDPDRVNQMGSGISTMDYPYKLSDAGFYISGRNCRLATPEEIYWLEQCIKLNKYISKDEIKPEIVNSYAIY